MDPYLSASSPQGLYNFQQPSASSGKSIDMRLVAGAVVCLLLLILSSWLLMRKKPSGGGGTSTSSTAVAAAGPVLPVSLAMPTPSPPATAYLYEPERMETREPDSKLTSFGFEYYLRPGFVPDLEPKLVPKPAGNPIYALVNCGVNNTRYAIRWQNKFLSVVTGDVLSWTDLKQEPNSCFVLVPGWCKAENGEDYVMLRSALNGHFLRAEEATGKLVCKDSPTQNTALYYCWKLRGPALASEQATGNCGCQFDPNVRAVVCKPCTVASSAAPATPAPLPGPWPELVNWEVRQAQAFLASKYPGISVYAMACPVNQPNCPLSIALPPNVPVVILRYNPENSRVIYAPKVDIITA